MARVQLFLCFTILLASVALLDVVSAHLKLKPSLPQIEDPKTLKDVEPYTVKVVMVFVSDLEKECPKTSKFKVFFEKLRAYAKYVCPIKRKDQVDYDRDLKAKAGGLVQAISSFAIGTIKEEIQEEKMEVINTFKYMRFVATKILGSRKKEESEESMKLSAEQQKEIKEGILRWETIIARITNTMITSTKDSSSSETSTTEKGDSSDKSKSSGSEGKGSSEDTQESKSNSGSPSGSPSSSPSGSSGKETDSKANKTTDEKSSAASGKETDSKDTKNTDEKSSATSGKETSTKDTKINGESSSAASGKETSSTDTKANGESSASENTETSQSGTVNVEQVEAETSKQVSSFIMNLEKKCPQKEEYKAFFEQLKGTMIAPVKEGKDLFTRIKSAAGKVSGAMAFIRSRVESKSAEVKQSMETYQGEVMKTLQELETIHSQIVSQNKGKKEGSLTCTPAQQMQIKQTITKWEQVTTQFVETATQTQTSSTSSTGKMVAN
ncbi:PREDICTED: mediator of RNA polymerase II transcription subunit 1-like [Camelina sativa]|uniref:Mediator of RNA polymerase II transcription subunit 1-like n=1 Tax=Camelina sativa TaxID=90675 RepID=A0ABM0YLL8_CAMSA|nr:PREDICTED: mediator of RNA polymerase II transcription subunit 1-like [Camelina sativa]